jgi:hypothetical protein
LQSNVKVSWIKAKAAKVGRTNARGVAVDAKDERIFVGRITFRPFARVGRVLADGSKAEAQDQR